MLGLKRRDDAAFNYLYYNYAQALYKTIIKVTPDAFLADDLLQEVYIKIWRNLDSYDQSKGRLFAWMSQIAKNMAIDIVRSKDNRQQVCTDELNEDLNNSIFLNTNIDLIDLQKQLVKLKPKYKVVIELAYYYDLKSEEMAKVLKIPVGTVKTRRKLALQQLRRIYKVPLLN